MKLAVAVLGCLLLTSCGGSGDEPSVDWSAFAPAVQQRIAQEVKAKDCAALQDEFDAADARSDREGAELMEYLDWHLKHSGCYE